MNIKIIVLLLFVTVATAENLLEFLQKIVAKYDEVPSEDVTFFLYNKQNMNRPIAITNETINNITNLTDPFKFIIHGFTDSGNKRWIMNIKNEYLKKGDYNVIAVDWTKPASKLYILSAYFTNQVGKFISDLLFQLNTTLNVPNENIHLIGHSLGAHVAGFAGKHSQERGQKIGRITGLDPAGPRFFNTPKDKRLSDDDASFVDIIHTDGYSNGYFDPLGQADFYPNGGNGLMPGCLDIDDFESVLEFVSCSHTMAYIYFTESINSNEFVAKICTSYTAYRNGSCSNNPEAVMGENSNPEARGIYYLSTNPKSLYARNGLP